MSIIPTYNRQQTLPNTTGMSGLPNVRTEDHIAKALTDFANQSKVQSEKLETAQALGEVTTASATAQIKLDKLENDLLAVDPSLVEQTHKIGVQKIYAETMSLVASKKGQASYGPKFNALSTASQIIATSAGSKRHLSNIQGTLHGTLNSLNNLIASDTTEFARNNIDSTGILAIDGAVESGVLSFFEGQKQKIKFAETNAKNGLKAWVNSETTIDGLLSIYDQMDSKVDKFTGAAAARHKQDWESLTESERNTIRKSVGTEIKSLQSTKNSLEARAEKESKQEQEDKTGSVMNLINKFSMGLEEPEDTMPTLNSIERLKKDKLISGKDQMLLEKAIVAIGNATTDESTLLVLQNQIYAIVDLSTQKERIEKIKEIRVDMLELSANGRLESQHASSLNSLLSKVQEQGFKGSAQVKARVSLRAILTGVVDEMTIANYNPDAGETIRSQKALNEYDERMETGEENAWDVHNDLIQRSSRALPKLSEFLQPPIVFSPKDDIGQPVAIKDWTLEDAKVAKEMLVQALKEGTATNTTYNREMKSLQGIYKIIARKEALSESSKEAQEEQKKQVERRKKN